MNIPDLTSSDLKKYRNDKEIIEATAKQIVKDFSLFGLEINYSEEIVFTWNELYLELENQIRHLLEINSAKILSLLYQIDIPENKIIERVEDEKAKLMSEVVAEMIMEREIKKVLTRMYFKKMKNNF
jgi:hypothetical protein